MHENVSIRKAEILPGIIPVVAFLCLVISLKIADSREVIEAPFLLAFLNTAFLSIIPIVLAFPAAVSYRSSGASGFILTGCGLVAFGLSNFYAGWLMPLAGNPNPTVTVHNTGSLLSGIFQFVAALRFIRELFGTPATYPGTRKPEMPYLLIAAAVSLVAALAYFVLLPVFFDPVHGPSLIRQVILGTAITLFFASGFVFLELSTITRSGFALWYGLSLLLTTVGLLAVLLQTGVGSALGWTGRAAQYAGSLYLLIAFFRTGRGIRKLWPYLEERVMERTKELTALNEALLKEIEERKRAEEKLKESEEQLKSSQSAAQVGHWTWDTATNRVSWSEEMYRIFGIDPEQFDGDLMKIIEATVHPEDRGRLYATNTAVINEGKTSPQEYRVIRSDGSIRTVRAKAGMSTVDRDGKILRLSGTVQDITENRRIEEALTTNRQLLRDIIDHSPALVYVLDTEGRFLMANKRLESILLCPHGGLTGRSRTDGMPEELARQHRANDLLVITSGRAMEFEEESLEKDGKHVYLTTKFPLTDTDGYVYAVCGISLDITSHKRAEAALRRNEEYLQAVYRNSEMGVFVVDVLPDCGYRYLGINPTHERLMGVKNEVVAGESPEVLIPYLGTDTVDHMVSLYDRCVRTGEPVESEHCIREGRAKGWRLLKLTPLFDEAGEKVVRLIGNAINISDRKQAEENIRKALSEKETLLRELYHRTKNNMAVIISFLQLQATYSDDEKLKTALKDAQNRVHSMALVHKKLYEARDLSQINLKDYISDLLPLVIRTYRTPGPEIAVERNMEDVYVLLDTAVPCGLAVNELLSNIMKYAFKGVDRGVIRITLHMSEEGFIDLSIADNGVGVPENFDFRNGGRLGLKTVFSLVEAQMQGQIRFTAGNGVTCDMRFKDAFYKPRV